VLRKTSLRSTSEHGSAVVGSLLPGDRVEATEVRGAATAGGGVRLRVVLWRGGTRTSGWASATSREGEVCLSRETWEDEPEEEEPEEQELPQPEPQLLPEQLHELSSLAEENGLLRRELEERSQSHLTAEEKVEALLGWVSALQESQQPLREAALAAGEQAAAATRGAAEAQSAREHEAEAAACALWEAREALGHERAARAQERQRRAAARMRSMQLECAFSVRPGPGLPGVRARTSRPSRAALLVACRRAGLSQELTGAALGRACRVPCAVCWPLLSVHAGLGGLGRAGAPSAHQPGAGRRAALPARAGGGVGGLARGGGGGARAAGPRAADGRAHAAPEGRGGVGWLARGGGGAPRAPG
jgi:hypothetical protein